MEGGESGIVEDIERVVESPVEEFGITLSGLFVVERVPGVVVAVGG